MKKIIKQFRAPFKSNSPNIKKKAHLEAHSNTNKLLVSANHPKKKNSAQNPNKPNIINKNMTETGPVIKKVPNYPRRSVTQINLKSQIGLRKYRKGIKSRSEAI